MKIPSLLLLLGIFLLFAPGAFAQESSTLTLPVTENTTQITTLSTPSNKNIILLDVVPLMQKGIGLEYQRYLTKRWSIGPYYSRYKDKSSWVFIDLESKIERYGIETRYKFSADPSKGFYLGLSYEHLKISSQSSAGGLFVSFPEEQSPSYNMNDMKVQLGYMIQGTVQNFGTFFVDIAYNYGSREPSALSSSASVNLSSGEVSKSELAITEFEKTAHFYAALGLLF